MTTPSKKTYEIYFEVNINNINQICKKNTTKISRIGSPRWLGSVNLFLQIKLEKVKLKSLEQKIKINHVQVQIGLTSMEEANIVIYLSPLDVYMKIKDKYKSLLAIQKQNQRETISNLALDNIIEDYKILLDIIDKKILDRIENQDL